MTIEERLSVLEQQMAAQVPTPTEYYTSRWSGEEIDKGINGALQLGGATTTQAALRNIGGRPNRNLLDNAYFKGGGSQQGGGQFPINQRGQTSYTTPGYTIDRWLLSHDTTAVVTVTEEGVALSNSGEGNLFLIQKSERVYDDRSEYTFSVLTAENMLYSAVLKPRSSTYPASGLYFSLSADSVTIGALAGNAWNIKAVKLESGSTQTLAHQDEDGNWVLNEIPDYGEELAKCQRYLVIYTVDGQRFCGVGNLDTASFVQAVIWTPVPMRIAPTISGDVSIYGAGNKLSGTDFTGAALGPTGIRGNFNVSNGVNYPTTVLLYTKNQLVLSAEL